MMDGGTSKPASALHTPSGWSQKSFYDLAKITSGQVDPRKAPYSSMILVAPDHIRTGSGRIDQRLTATQQGAISGKYLVQKGEVIYSKIRPNLQKLALADEECLCSADMYPVAAKEGVSAHFLKYLMLSAPFTDFATSVSVRSGMPKINRQELAHFAAMVPESFEEQEAIAEALSDADALIEGLERLIAKKRLIKQGAMQDLLTAKRRLPGFSGEWVECKLGALLTVRHGRSQKDVEAPSGQYPILATGGQIGTASAYLWNKPSVLIGRKGTIDRPQFIETPFWTVDTLFYTDIHSPNDPRFLFYVFQRIDWQSYNEASGVPSLNAKTIESIEVVVPGADEQVVISGVLQDMDAEIQALDTRLEKARQVKEGMMQNLLTGRIRLV